MFTNVNLFVVMVTRPLRHYWLSSLYRSELGEEASVTAVSEDPLENLGDFLFLQII